MTLTDDWNFAEVVFVHLFQKQLYKSIILLKKALQKPATQINLKVCGKILVVLLYDLISSLQ